MTFVSKWPSYRRQIAALLLAASLGAVAGCSSGTPAAATPTRPAAAPLGVTVQAPSQAPAGSQATPEAPAVGPGTAYPEPTALQPYPVQTP